MVFVEQIYQTAKTAIVILIFCKAEHQKQTIRDSMKKLMTAAKLNGDYTVQIVPRTDEKDYVEIFKGDGSVYFANWVGYI